jgi:hypothetical protein
MQSGGNAMSPLGKHPHEPSAVNRRLKYVGRCNLVVARLMVPFMREPRAIQHGIVTCDRDIYQETVDALGYDPLAQRSP